MLRRSCAAHAARQTPAGTPSHTMSSPQPWARRRRQHDQDRHGRALAKTKRAPGPQRSPKPATVAAVPSCGSSCPFSFSAATTCRKGSSVDSFCRPRSPGSTFAAAQECRKAMGPRRPTARSLQHGSCSSAPLTMPAIERQAGEASRGKPRRRMRVCVQLSCQHLLQHAAGGARRVRARRRAQARQAARRGNLRPRAARPRHPLLRIHNLCTYPA